MTAAVARELHARLAGARLRAHDFDWKQRQLTLFFRSATLRWHLHSGAGWVILDEPLEPPESARPLAAELEVVEAYPDERFLRFHFRKLRGRVRRIQIIVELMTNQWNAILAEGDEGWVRHLLWSRRTRGRELVVGSAYPPPMPSERKGKTKPLSKEEWQSHLEAHRQDGTGGALLETVAFTSSLNLPALLRRDPGSQPSGASNLAGYSLWLRLKSLDGLQPCLLETTQGSQPYPFVLDGFKALRMPTILDAILTVSDKGETADASTGDLKDRLDSAIRNALGRVRGLERERMGAGNPEETRETANLLLARLGEIKRGASQATIVDFHGEKVTLQLDPSMSPHENAQALYEEAARQERALKRLPPLLRKAEAEVARLESLREKLVDGKVDGKEAERQLPSRAKKKRWKGGGQAPRLPYKRFRSTGGLEIRVGRGPSENDELTFRHTRPDDIWLHAREAGGAHVVLRWDRTESPPARDLTEAAVLAALHSGGRGSSVVPVDWTRKKYVRKPRKAPRGTVTPSQAQTLFVRPDPELPHRLRWEE